MTRYDGTPGHPLAGVPQEVLNAARDVLIAATHSHDVDAELAEPIADSVVAALHRANYLDWDGAQAPSHVGSLVCASCDGTFSLDLDTVAVVRWSGARRQNVLVATFCAPCWAGPTRDELVAAVGAAQWLWETSLVDTGRSLAETVVDQVGVPLLRKIRGESPGGQGTE